MKSFINEIYQCGKETNTAMLANAIIWATVLIASSWLLRGAEHADTLLIIILSAAAGSILFTNQQRKRK